MVYVVRRSVHTDYPHTHHLDCDHTLTIIIAKKEGPKKFR